jgi:C-terminal processing protease CtpA/Prc
MNATDNALSGRALYHAIWAAVQGNFFDADRLKDWGSFEHRFDQSIIDDETALRFAAEALSSLNDRYTCLLPIDAPVLSNTPAPDAAPQDGASEAVTCLLSASNLGYVRILNFDSPNFVEELEEKLKVVAHCDGYILDLRANRGGLVDQAAKAAQFFIHEGTITSFVSRSDQGTTTRHVFATTRIFGYTDEMPDGTTQTERFERKGYPLAGKVSVVLLGPKTASAAELFAAAVLCNNYAGFVLSVGRATAGKGIVQKYIDILGKVKLQVSYCRFLAPTGDWFGDDRQTVVNEIEPDVIVQDDTGVEGLKVAREQLGNMIAALTQTP